MAAFETSVGSCVGPSGLKGHCHDPGAPSPEQTSYDWSVHLSGVADTRRTARTLLGAALALLGLVGYVWLVDAGTVVATLGRLSAPSLVALVVAGFVSPLVWGVSLWLVLGGLGVDCSVPTAVSLFLGSVFLNGVTPFGQVGGDPPSGLLIASVSATTFEEGVAAIGSVNALNRLAVGLLGVGGVTALASRAAVDADLWAATVVAVAVGGVLALGGVLAWVHRETVAAVVADLLADGVVRIVRPLPLVPTPSRETVVGRVRGFVAALERLAGRPRRLLAAFLLGLVGHLAVAGTLWLAVASLDVGIPPAFVLAVIPVLKLTGATPLPGGTGGAELLLSGLLTTAVGLAAPVATAAALLYRAVAFWLPTVAGGLVTVALVFFGGHEDQADEVS